jgi:hypothetical protein
MAFSHAMGLMTAKNLLVSSKKTFSDFANDISYKHAKSQCNNFRDIRYKYDFRFFK